MAKKASGLGRGLGELMADNAPEVHGGGTVIKKEGDEAIVITPKSGGPLDTAPVKKTKGLYDDLPRTNSLKANFKNFK